MGYLQVLLPKVKLSYKIPKKLQKNCKKLRNLFGPR